MFATLFGGLLCKPLETNIS